MNFKDYRKKVIGIIQNKRKDILREVEIAFAYYEIYRTMHEYELERQNA